MRSEYEGSPAAVPGTGAEWVVMIHSGGWTKEWRGALERWRAASAENDLDFRKAESVWVMSGDLAEDPHIRAELDALRRKAHRLNGSDAVSSRSWLLPSWHSRFAAAAAVGALVVALTFLVSSEHGLERYETTFGKPQTFDLQDGSRIAVNSESIVAVRYDGVRREATLEKGEAMFDVAKDPKRPFTARPPGPRGRRCHRLRRPGRAGSRGPGHGLDQPRHRLARQDTLDLRRLVGRAGTARAQPARLKADPRARLRARAETDRRSPASRRHRRVRG